MEETVAEIGGFETGRRVNFRMIPRRRSHLKSRTFLSLVRLLSFYIDEHENQKSDDASNQSIDSTIHSENGIGKNEYHNLCSITDTSFSDKRSNLIDRKIDDNTNGLDELQSKIVEKNRDILHDEFKSWEKESSFDRTIFLEKTGDEHVQLGDSNVDNLHIFQGKGITNGRTIPQDLENVNVTVFPEEIDDSTVIPPKLDKINVELIDRHHLFESGNRNSEINCSPNDISHEEFSVEAPHCGSEEGQNAYRNTTQGSISPSCMNASFCELIHSTESQRDLVTTTHQEEKNEYFTSICPTLKNSFKEEPKLTASSNKKQVSEHVHRIDDDRMDVKTSNSSHTIKNFADSNFLFESITNVEKNNCNVCPFSEVEIEDGEISNDGEIYNCDEQIDSPLAHNFKDTQMEERNHDSCGRSIILRAYENNKEVYKGNETSFEDNLKSLRDNIEQFKARNDEKEIERNANTLGRVGMSKLANKNTIKTKSKLGECKKGVAKKDPGSLTTSSVFKSPDVISDKAGSQLQLQSFESKNEKKKRSPLTAERKEKKRIAKKLKRAKKNKEQGVKRLKLPLISKPKPVKYCSYFLKGRCYQGESCKLSHDTVPLTKSQPCKYFACNSCLKGDDCPFDHQLEKYPCHSYAKEGKCRRGDRCLFSHKIPSSEDSAPALVAKDILSTPISNAMKQSKEKNSPTSKNSCNKATFIPPWSTNMPQAPLQAPKGINFLSYEKEQPTLSKDGHVNICIPQSEAVESPWSSLSCPSVTSGSSRLKNSSVLLAKQEVSRQVPSSQRGSEALEIKGPSFQKRNGSGFTSASQILEEFLFGDL